MRGVLEAERHRRTGLLPPDAQCEVCGEADPLVLEADASILLCADHAAVASGREPVEEHHLAGRPWLIVLNLTSNWHRIVSTLQRAKPKSPNFTVELLRGIAYLIWTIADFLDKSKPSST